MGKVKVKRKTPYVLVALLCAGIALALLGLDSRLCVQEYEVDAERLKNHIKIALIADLHACGYGQGEAELTALLEAQSPDIVLLAGDIFDDRLPDKNAADFLESISGKYPCFYVTGNHEYWSGAQAFAEKMQILRRCGVKHLENDAEMLTVHGENIRICGLDDPDAVWLLPGDRRRGQSLFLEKIEAARQYAAGDAYTILLAHRPEYMAEYARGGFDLILSGHAHGGQWRIPGLLNGLYAPNQGLFPRYAGGKYTAASTTMVVSRGLARESTAIPRFFNRPEIVIIDLH